MKSKKRAREKRLKEAYDAEKKKHKKTYFKHNSVCKSQIDMDEEHLK
jgi:hypothetical protein